MTRIFIFFSFLFSFSILAQDVPIGGWNEHLSYKSGLSVAEGNGKVYCATTSGIFSLNKGDNSMTRMSKVNGLSDVEATVLNYNTFDSKLLIAYKNSNIDIVDNNGSITNISDIKRKSIIGNKSINNIFFINQYAYLSCGFGIVVIDMDRLEVKDTYYIGPLGNAINVMDMTTDGTYFYASTGGGIYKALESNPNLANYTAWSKMPGLPNGIYNTICVFNGNVYTNFSKFFVSGAFYSDTTYFYNGTSWAHYGPGVGATNYQLRNQDNQLLLVQETAVLTYNAALANVGYFNYYFGNGAQGKSAVIDNAGTVWIADAKSGLVSWKAASGFASNYPNGPASPNLYSMNLNEGNLWVVPGGKQTYYKDGLYWYSDGEWKNPKGGSSTASLDSVYDIVDVLVDPLSSSTTYATSWGKGLVQLYNGVPVKIYNESNSSLQGLHIAGFNEIWLSGMAMDANNNLWVANSGSPYALSVKNANGTWHKINFSAIAGNFPYLGKVLVDKHDQKWINFTTGGGLIVYKGGVLADANSGNARKLTTAPGNGALPSPDVFCMAEDQDGEIWVGTSKGIAVFYSPENVFTGGNFDAQQILIEQDGHVQILLETEVIQAIAVDDANRKWIATAKSGVFLMSSDGTQQIYHFDEDNSPLFSNNVKDIAIDHNTGEIYFGTDKGIISYRGTATKGEDCFKDVYSFPNPVKPDYDGPIAIKGLVANTTVKITDISGTLVYQTKSEGGQAIWYGKNFNGERVSTGVYMVFCTSENTDCQKIATKILVIN